MMKLFVGLMTEDLSGDFIAMVAGAFLAHSFLLL